MYKYSQENTRRTFSRKDYSRNDGERRIVADTLHLYRTMRYAVRIIKSPQYGVAYTPQNVVWFIFDTSQKVPGCRFQQTNVRNSVAPFRKQNVNAVTINFSVISLVTNSVGFDI